MASIRKETVIAAPLSAVWDAVRDYGALHTRLAAGFATDCRLEGDDRIVTFVHGAVLRERLITSDDGEHRLVWSIVDGPYEHHNGAVELFEAGPGLTRFVWTADLLPDALQAPTAASMEQGLAAIVATLTAAPN